MNISWRGWTWSAVAGFIMGMWIATKHEGEPKVSFHYSSVSKLVAEPGRRYLRAGVNLHQEEGGR
jgi:hypothetical protein